MMECENLRVGREYLNSVSWPPALREDKYDRCYCSQCYPSTKPDTLEVAGRVYVLPRGWTRFGVNIDHAFFAHHNIWKSWVNCYHGTSIKNAISIVEHRQLLLPNDVTMGGKKIQICEGHIPEQHFFFTTPTIRYAGLEYYARTYEFESPSNSKSYHITVALQCKQNPGSFIVQPETVRATEQQIRICPHIPNEELEWKTKQRSAIMPYALMLQIVKIDDNGDRYPLEPQSTINTENAGIKTITYPRETPVVDRRVCAPDTHSGTSTVYEDYEYGQRMTKKKIAVLIILILLTLPPAAMLAIGQIYRSNCPIQPWIPQWMTIFGAVGVGTFSSLFCIVCITFKCCSDRKTIGHFTSGCMSCLLLLFFLAWLIVGSLWLFPTKSKVQFNEPDSADYCQRNLYMITFGFILAQYGLAGLFICCFSIAGLCWICREH